MLYTPSHAELAQHPKTRKLARLLGVSIPTAIGHLHLLWHFALKYAPDGDLTPFDDADLAEGVLWEGDPQRLSVALYDAGYVDVGPDALAGAEAGDAPLRITLHDWCEYGGKVAARREANAERMRQARAERRSRTPRQRAAQVDSTFGERVEPEERRGEKKRVEHTPPLSPPAGGEPPPPAADRTVLPGRSSGPPRVRSPEPPPRLPNAVPKPSREPPPDLAAAFDRFWRAWPKRVGRAEALAAFAKLRPTDDDVGAMVAAIPIQSAALNWPRERYRYCPKPATWLGERRWEDEMPEERPSGPQDRPYVSTNLDAAMAFMRSGRTEA